MKNKIAFTALPARTVFHDAVGEAPVAQKEKISPNDVVKLTDFGKTHLGKVVESRNQQADLRDSVHNNDGLKDFKGGSDFSKLLAENASLRVKKIATESINTYGNSIVSADTATVVEEKSGEEFVLPLHWVEKIDE